MSKLFGRFYPIASKYTQLMSGHQYIIQQKLV